jgi:hypothetical protein
MTCSGMDGACGMNGREEVYIQSFCEVTVELGYNIMKATEYFVSL